MSDASLTTIYSAISALAYTCFAVAPQDKWNTYPRIVIQQLSEEPAQHLSGISPLREVTATVSIYHTSFSAAKTLSDSVVSAVMALDQIFLDSTDSSLDDRGDGTTLVVHRITNTFTLFTGAS